MKTKWLQTTLLLALVCLSLPARSDDAKEAEPLPEDDTVLGTWYVQFMEGQVMPLDERLKFVLGEDGTVKLFQGEKEDESGTYSHDEQNAKITIYDKKNPKVVELVFKYSFVDDMMVIRYTEGQANDGNDREERMELTRKPEGTERHQKMRDKQGDRPSHKKRMQQIRLFFVAVMSYHADQAKVPDSLGDLVVGDYITPKSAVPKPAQDKLPKDFEDWKDQAKRDWINQHAGCVYIKVDLNDPQIDASKMITIFDVPADKEQEKVVMVFGDGHSELKSYKEADREISKQTGHTLEKWMKTTTPGSGKMVVPEKVIKDKAPAE